MAVNWTQLGFGSESDTPQVQKQHDFFNNRIITDC